MNNIKVWSTFFIYFDWRFNGRLIWLQDRNSFPCRPVHVTNGIIPRGVMWKNTMKLCNTRLQMLHLKCRIIKLMLGVALGTFIQVDRCLPSCLGLISLQVVVVVIILINKIIYRIANKSREKKIPRCVKAGIRRGGSGTKCPLGVTVVCFIVSMS